MDTIDTVSRVEALAGEEKRSESKPATAPTTEVATKPSRRVLTAKYKRWVVEEAEKYRARGEIGAFLRREGLYSSQLSDWREQYRDAGKAALTERKRGRKAKEINPLDKKVRELEQQNRRLQKKLSQAKAIIDIQKKVAAMLGNDSDEETS